MTKKPANLKPFVTQRAFEYALDVLLGNIKFEGSINDLKKKIKDEFDFPVDWSKKIVENAVIEYNIRKKETETETTQTEIGNETTPLNFEWNLDPRDLEVIKLIHEYKFRNVAFQHSSIPKASFYRITKKMVDKGILVTIKPEMKGMQESLIIHPAFIDNFVIPQYVSQDSLTGMGEEKPVSQNETQQTDEIEPNIDQITQIERELLRENSLFSSKARGKNETTLSKIYEIIRNWDTKQFEIDIRKIRTHSLMMNLRISKKPSKLEEMLEDSESFGLIPRMKNWKPFHNKGMTGTLSRLQLKAYIRFNIDVITIAIPEIIGNDAYYNSMMGLKKIIDIKELLENEFHGLELEPNLDFKLTNIKSPEHAVISGLPALERLALESREMRVSLKGENVQIDESPKRPEAEFINKIKASTHITKEFLDYDFRAESGVYFEDLVNYLAQLKSDNIVSENKILKKLQEVEDNLDIKIELESLLNQIETEKVKAHQSKFESSLIPFIQRLHDEREARENQIIQTQKDLIGIIKTQGDTLNNQQQSINLLSDKILKKSLLDKLKERLKVKGE